MLSEDLNVSTEFTFFKKLNKTNNDKYEYIFPKINLSKNIA